jgi:phosphopantetheine--protein transferase-like protein
MKPTDPRTVVELSSILALSTEMPANDLWLSENERQRLSTMTAPQRRRQFLAGHWLLRRLAAQVHGGAPTQWSLSAGPDRVPWLHSISRPDAAPIHASLSHSGDWLAVAIAPNPIGVDLERPARSRDLLALAAAVFSPDECAELRRMPEGERAAAFYVFWTIKESVGKREGHGLHRQSTQRQKPLACGAENAEVHSWQFNDVSLALATEAGRSVAATGLPDTAIRRYWRIGSA